MAPRMAPYPRSARVHQRQWFTGDTTSTRPTNQMESAMHSVMVICVGLGIGLSVARRFAHEGLPVAGVRVRRKGDVSAA